MNHRLAKQTWKQFGGILFALILAFGLTMSAGPMVRASETPAGETSEGAADSGSTSEDSSTSEDTSEGTEKGTSEDSSASEDASEGTEKETPDDGSEESTGEDKASEDSGTTEEPGAPQITTAVTVNGMTSSAEASATLDIDWDTIHDSFPVSDTIYYEGLVKGETYTVTGTLIRIVENYELEEEESEEDEDPNEDETSDEEESSDDEETSDDEDTSGEEEDPAEEGSEEEDSGDENADTDDDDSSASEDDTEEDPENEDEEVEEQVEYETVMLDSGEVVQIFTQVTMEFEAEDTNGSWIMDFGSVPLWAGSRYVVFEEVYAAFGKDENATQEQPLVHKDINDKAQTFLTGSPEPMVLGASLEKTDAKTASPNASKPASVSAPTTKLTTSPKTADGSQPMLWVGLMAACFMGMCLIRRRKAD